MTGENAFDCMAAAVAEARVVLRARDSQAKKLLEMLADCDLSKLEYSASALKALKKQLARYNIHTDRWRKP